MLLLALRMSDEEMKGKKEKDIATRQREKKEGRRSWSYKKRQPPFMDCVVITMFLTHFHVSRKERGILAPREAENLVRFIRRRDFVYLRFRYWNRPQ